MSEEKDEKAYRDTLFLGVCTLDHDGCVVCSDAGVPLRVITVDGNEALCEDVVGNRTVVAIDLVTPVEIGDVLLMHGGVAIGKVYGGAVGQQDFGVNRSFEEDCDEVYE